MTHSNDDFQVDAFNFRHQVVQLGFAGWLDHGFVKVKECISSISDFSSSSHWSSWSGFGGSNWSRRRSSNYSAVTASGGGGRRPAGITPAQTCGVFPHVTRGVTPVVNVLSYSSGSQSSGSNKSCQVFQVFHD